MAGLESVQARLFLFPYIADFIFLLRKFFLSPRRKSFFLEDFFMFQALKLVFQALEHVYQSLELMFQALEYKILRGEKTFSLRVGNFSP